jgi:hypothetical protein
MSDWVWYAGYGSNLSRARFACYLEGGTPAGAGLSYTGCRDRTPARDSTPLRLRGRLRFGGESRVWGGGLAFLDPHADDEVVARGYLITTEQLADVARQERKYDERPVVGGRDGVPVVAFTSTGTHQPAAPSAAYLRTVLAGLTDGLLDLDAAVAYLLAAPGVDLGWDAASIRAVAA